MGPEEQLNPPSSESARSLSVRNDLHYDDHLFEQVDWSNRGEYMERKHGITPDVAEEALSDPDRVVIDPDYASTSGRSVRIIGYSQAADVLVTVIVLRDAGIEYGVNGWRASEKDSRIYSQDRDVRDEGESDERGR